MAASVGTLRALPRFRRRCAFARRLQINARASCLREPDRNGLLRRARAMLAFADMVDLLANELACLRAGSFAFASIATRPLQRSFLRHVLSPQRRPQWAFEHDASAVRCVNLSLGHGLPGQ
jgi:hypothetical protein